MNIAAYCRVSTEKADQLSSLQAQKAFFTEYAHRIGANLVHAVSYTQLTLPTILRV